MSTQAPAPGPPAPQSGDAPSQPPTQQQGGGAAMAAGAMSIGGLASILFYILYSYGAAKLSYDKFGSIGWAILDFIFAVFYYPYYAIFLSGPSQQSAIGGRRRR